MKTKVLLKLIEALYSPEPPPAGGFVTLPEADAGCTPFAALDAEGEIFIIGYKGEWYTPVKPALRARLRNWIVGHYNRKLEADVSG